MDKLQFLNFTDVDASEEETLNHLLYNGEYPEAVIMPPEIPPVWTQPVPYPELAAMCELASPCCAAAWIPAAYTGVILEPETVGVEEHMEEVERQMEYAAAGTQMMVPQTMQFTQMMGTPSVYVGNMTANVNVHGYMAQPMTYSPNPYIATQEIPAAGPPSRKQKPTKTPTKRSPEVRRTMESPQTPNFTPQFPPQYFPPGPIYPGTPMWYAPIPTHALQPRPFVTPVPPVFTPNGATFPQVFSPTHHIHQPPSEPREETTVAYPAPEEVEKVEELEPEHLQQVEVQPQPVYQEPISEEEPVPVVVENELPPEREELPTQTLPDPPTPVVPVNNPPVEEVKVEKPLANKLPPANAFKSAPAPVAAQKPPFSARQKQLDNGPEFIDPPVVDAGPKKKSFASLFGSGDRTAVQMANHETMVSKPLATVHPTVHNNVNAVAPRVHNNVDYGKQNCVEKEPARTQSTNFPSLGSGKVNSRAEKIVDDYDINLQRLGEFLVDYKLDYKPLLLQPRGLTNRSNYCYINAILQALIACPPFYNLMKAIPPSQENKNAKSRTPIIDSMVKFVNEFELMSGVTRPQGRKEKQQATKEGSGAVEVVSGPALEPVYVYKMLNAMPAAFPVEGRQEDAEEFLSCLLNGLNDEMLEAMKLVKPTTNGLTNGDVNGEATTNGDVEGGAPEWRVVKQGKSVVTRRAEADKTPLSTIFRGQMRSRVIRPNGSTDNIQPFFTLQLDIEKANSVDEALEQLMDKDEVFGVTCPKTNQEIAMFTQTSLEELPLILMLHLKCFDYKLHTCSKIMKTLQFPVELKFDNKLELLTNKNNKNKSTKDRPSNKDRQYKLVAVVYHDGKEATKGHYLTDVFHVGCGGWVRFDDASVRAVTLDQVMKPRTPRVPYLLYYRRCDTMHTDNNR